MKNREIHLRDVAKALAWMLRLLLAENRRFKSRRVGKGVLLEQKPAVNYSYGWNSPGFPKANASTKTVQVPLLLFDSPRKHQSMFVPFIVSLCLIMLEDENPPVASTQTTQPTPFTSGGFPVWWLFGRGQCYDCYGAHGPDMGYAAESHRNPYVHILHLFR